MNTERHLQRSLFLVVGWSALMLGLAEGSLLPTPLTVPIVVVAWLAERRGGPRCPPWLAAVFGLFAFLLAALEFSYGSIESRLLSVAHTIVYLTWVVLFLRKGAREYWLLAALALLQVAVGAVLTIEGWYGALLLVDTVLMLYTLAVFCQFQGQAEYGSLELRSHPMPETPDGESGPFRQPGATSGAAQIDAADRWLGSRFHRAVAKVLLLTAVLAGTVFATVPRIWIGTPFADVAMKAGREQSVALTGFSDTVRLGEMGTILESTKPVLRIRLFDNDTNQQLDIADVAAIYGMEEPMFRGSVMSSYKDGEWEKSDVQEFQRVPIARDDEAGTIRQEIDLHPTGTRLLFVFGPYTSIRIPGARDQARVDVVTLAVQNPRGMRMARSYVVNSVNSFRRGFNAWSYVPKRGRDWVCSELYSDLPTSLRQLRSLAASVAGTLEGGEPAPQLQAERIAAYLKDPDRFTYSLTAQRQDQSLDPIEDFLVNHRTGNCEFFASAMALMLRAQNIPARVVTGFKGGYTNDIDGTFEVQQLHAHTWVEAYINDQWSAFDPTPAARSQAVGSMSLGMKSLTDLRMWLNTLWSRLVVNMSLADQKSRLYDPVKAQFQAFTRAVTGQGRGGWKTAVSARTWVSVPGVLALILIIAGVAVALRRRLGPWLRRLFRLRGDRSADQRPRPVVAFYERFRKLCAAHGLQRAASQTELEFAAMVESEWKDRLRGLGLQAFPRTIVGAFYRVRFGEQPLTDANCIRLGMQLEQLERGLATGDSAAMPLETVPRPA